MYNQHCCTRCLQRALRRSKLLTSQPLWAAATFGGAGGTQKAPKSPFIYLLPARLLVSSTPPGSPSPGTPPPAHVPPPPAALSVHHTKAAIAPNVHWNNRAAIVEVNYCCTTLCWQQFLELGILGVWIYFMLWCSACLQPVRFTGKPSSQAKKPGRSGPLRGRSCSPESATATNSSNSARSALDPAMWWHSVPLRTACKPSPKVYLLYWKWKWKKQQNMVKI